MGTQAYYIQVADAQAKLPNNSVSSETIVNGQVKTDDLATDAVTSGKIKNGEVKAEDIAAGVIPDGGGAIELTTHEVQGEIVNVNAGSSGAAFADCPDGELLTGGGFVAEEFLNVILNKKTVNDDNEWEVTAHNVGSDPSEMIAYAMCLNFTP